MTDMEQKLEAALEELARLRAEVEKLKRKMRGIDDLREELDQIQNEVGDIDALREGVEIARSEGENLAMRVDGELGYLQEKVEEIGTKVEDIDIYLEIVDDQLRRRVSSDQVAESEKA